jgi:hypothetical protein
VPVDADHGRGIRDDAKRPLVHLRLQLNLQLDALTARELHVQVLRHEAGLLEAQAALAHVEPERLGEWRRHELHAVHQHVDPGGLHVDAHLVDEPPHGLHQLVGGLPFVLADPGATLAQVLLEQDDDAGIVPQRLLARSHVPEQARIPGGHVGRLQLGERARVVAVLVENACGSVVGSGRAAQRLGERQRCGSGRRARRSRRRCRRVTRLCRRAGWRGCRRVPCRG